MLTTETQINLRAFRLAVMRMIDANAATEYGSRNGMTDTAAFESRIDNIKIKALDAILGFALAGYDIGEIEVSDFSISAGMRIAGMHGIIMFRDNEVTAHT